MVFHGLLRYGYRAEAAELAEKTFRMVLSERRTHEYYNAEHGGGMGLNPFWGWSALGYLMPLELSLDYDPTDLARTEFRPLAKEFFGLGF